MDRATSRTTTLATRDSVLRGFTLIELLVVAAIIAVVGSLIFEALSKAKEQSKSVACKANLRQLGLAIIMYASDSRVYPVTYHDPPNLEIDPHMRGWWPILLLSYAGDTRQIFDCPANPPGFRWTNSPADGCGIFQKQGIGYGYNAHGSGIRDAGTVAARGLGLGDTPGGLRESEVVAPADMISFADSARDSHIMFVVRPPTRYGPSLPLGKRHKGRSNLVLCDGHVEQGKPEELTDRNPDTRRRWNFDNQPHSETWE